ncbi:MAG: WG repeat-containing protein [Bacillota bacterium]|nr:WG repeat-containing protein [Bacillota bacterium]
MYVKLGRNKNEKNNFDYAQPYDCNGRAIVYQNNLMGLVDDKGNTVIEPKYDGILPINCKSNYYKVKANELWGLIDLNEIY